MLNFVVVHNNDDVLRSTFDSYRVGFKYQTKRRVLIVNRFASIEIKNHITLKQRIRLTRTRFDQSIDSNYVFIDRSYDRYYLCYSRSTVRSILLMLFSIDFHFAIVDLFIDLCRGLADRVYLRT